MEIIYNNTNTKLIISEGKVIGLMDDRIKGSCDDKPEWYWITVLNKFNTVIREMEEKLKNSKEKLKGKFDE